MPKSLSFVDKMLKKADTVECPECKSPIESVLVVEPDNNNPKGTWRFHEHFVGVCKCNHKEIYG